MSDIVDKIQSAEEAITLPRHWHSLVHVFLHQARKRPHNLAIADSSGARLTYLGLLVASVALANHLREDLKNEQCVGILLPPSAGAVIANLGVALLGKIPVNLNYTFSQQMFDHSVQNCDINTILTSEKVLKRLPIAVEQRLIKLEDTREEVDLFEKATAWCEGTFIPEDLLRHFIQGLSHNQLFELDKESASILPVTNPNADRINDVATVIFTSGSTGVPKGVVLSQSNILSNIHAVREQGNIQPGEVVLGAIPFFHSFGLTMTLWAPLCLGETVIYHYDPLDAKMIGKLCRKFSITALISTPTMMNLYLRRCEQQQLETVRTILLGGEKVTRRLYEQLDQKLGIVPMEGYGLAETSPIIACNVPEEVAGAAGRTVDGSRAGTVGQPLPGTSIKIEDMKTGEELPAGKEGCISVSGPQIMLGYLNQPELNAATIENGWFQTGDVGLLDKDGFLTITGRMSQFSKIGGEMVPHLGIKEEIIAISGAAGEKICVTSVPEEGRGERLVVVHSEIGATPEEVVKGLRKADIPRLWIPKEQDFVQLKELPIMPNGKLDLYKIKQIALQQRGASSK